MAIGIYFDGRRLIRPQAVTKIDDSGMYARGLGGANNLALIGECTGGEPGVVQWFTDPAYAKAILRSGPLLQAIQRAYAPSAEDPGAYLVGAIRVNPATQSTLTLTDSSLLDLVALTSVDYGAWNNQLKFRLENGTASGSKKVTITYGSTYEQGDNIYRNSIYIALADPKAYTGTLKISKATGLLTTTVVSNVQKGCCDWIAAPNDIVTAKMTLGVIHTPKFSTAIDTGKYIWVGSDQPFSRVDFDLGLGVPQDNIIASAIEYYNGTTWVTAAGLNDTTKLTGRIATLNLTPAAPGNGYNINDTLTLAGGTGGKCTVATLTGGPGTGVASVTFTPPTGGLGPDSRGYGYTTGIKATTVAPAGGVGCTIEILAIGNSTLAQSGYMSYTMPTTWGKTTYTGPSGGTESLYWIRIKADGAAYSLATMESCGVRRGLSVTLGDYPYIQQLLDYLDAQAGYEVVAATTKPDTELSTDLDDVGVSGAEVNLKQYETYLTLPYASGRTLTVDSVFGFSSGDYIVIADPTGTAEETRRIVGTPVGTTITIDSALSTTYVSSSIVRKTTTLTSSLQAVIDWVNSNSSYITAALATTAVNRAYGWKNGAWASDEPLLKNIPDTYLENGGEGTTAQANWDAALEVLQNEDVPLISCISYDPAVWASLSAHCTYMSTVGKKERIGFCGGFATADGYTNGLGKWNGAIQIAASINQMITYAEQLNTDRICYVGPGFTAYDENGLLTTYDGSISAALVAGMAAGVDVAEALTHDTISVVGLEYNFKWADLDRLLEGGILPLEYEPGYGYRVCQSITTWLRNDKYNRRELSVRRTSDYVARQVRERLERDFVGSKGTLTTLISIKNATISVLTQMVRLQLLAGDATNPPFKNIVCRLEGDTCYVEFECSPVIPINYIPITVHLTVFTTTLTA